MSLLLYKEESCLLYPALDSTYLCGHQEKQHLIDTNCYSLTCLHLLSLDTNTI